MKKCFIARRKIAEFPAWKSTGDGKE